MKPTSPWTYGGATFSADRVYRHHLWRAKYLGASVARRLGVTMHNPSNAGEIPIKEDDATIRKLNGFCDRWGFHRHDVGNLSDFCATDPTGLYRARFPVSEYCDRYIAEVIRSCHTLLVAWGAVKHPRAIGRAKEILLMADMAGIPTVCIGLTKHGHPLHPVMAGYTNEPILFDGAVYTGMAA